MENTPLYYLMNDISVSEVKCKTAKWEFPPIAPKIWKICHAQ